MLKSVSTLINGTLRTLLPEQWKGHKELQYWKTRKVHEGDLSNEHYEYFYTGHFGLDHAFYEGKAVLDIGCGPRGSLEWAGMAKRRVGLDPLADKYRKLGADRHAMEYAHAPAEAMPFDDATFDVICSFNSLDHVADVDGTIREIKRVLRPGGLLLLLVEVNHAPTVCEPHCLRPEISEAFAPELTCTELDAYVLHDAGLYHSIEKGQKHDTVHGLREPAWLSAKFEKRTD